MQNTVDASSAPAPPAYRERLGPSLWTLVSAAVVAPMAGLVFVPLNTAVSLVIGIAVAVVVVTVMVAAAPVVEVGAGQLRAGRARIPIGCLGTPIVLSGDAARLGRGPELDPRAWHLIRGGIDGLVRVPVTDADDPHPEWVLASRTPDRLAAAIRKAQAMPSTPGRSDPPPPRGPAASGA